MRNQTNLDGYIARIEDIKKVGAKETSLLKFCVACTNGKGEYENTVFLDCTAWGKQAEMVNQYFTKGKAIGVSGDLKQDNWEDKTSGAKRSKITLNITKVDFPLGQSKSSEREQVGVSDTAGKLGPIDIPF